MIEEEKEQVSSYQKELEKVLSDLSTPFATSSFPKKIPRKDITAFLNSLVKKSSIQKKKIGSTYIYWKIGEQAIKVPKSEPPPSGKTAAKDDFGDDKKLLQLQRKLERVENEKTALNDEISELKEKLQEEKDRNARLRKVDAIDEIENEWVEIAYRMGESLAYMRGVTLKDILKQFGAPSGDYNRK
ncbi:MAG: hypothetical protein ACFFD4_33160 [Candidatus Odinarchaeota archaeon]